MYRPASVIGFSDEREYVVKVNVERRSQTDYQSLTLWTTNLPPGDFSGWDNGSHTNLDVRKERSYFYLRRDVTTPSGDYLVIRGELYITNSVEEDLVVARRMIESVKALR